MHEQEKISEAEYFYARMRTEANNPSAFKFDLSAFLSATRSVLQYALKEAETKIGGQAWYDNHISKSKVAKFFKDRRDINIHQKPLSLSQSVTVKIQDVIRVSEAIFITKIDEQGNRIQEENSSSTQVSLPGYVNGSVETEYSYSFSEWSSTNNVFDICNLYLTELRAIIQDGIDQKLLTP